MMRSLITTSMVALALFGSTVLAAGMAANLVSPKGNAIPVRPAVFQQNDAAVAAAQPAPAADDKAVQAAPAPGAVDAPYTHVVRLASDGRLAGKVSMLNESTGAIEPAEDLTVWFMQNGEVKATTKPGVAGVFQAEHLAPGVYSIIAAGGSGYLAIGVHVLPYEAPKAGGVAEAGFAINSLVVPPRDTLKVLQIANAYVPPAARTAALPAAREKLSAEQAAAVAAAHGAPVADPDALYVVALAAGNRLNGMLTRLDPQTGDLLKFHQDWMKAFLVQGDLTISESFVQEDGSFAFAGVKPGDYTLVAAGAEGFTAFAIRVVNAGGVVNAESQPVILPVSFAAKNAAAAGGINGSVIDMANFPAAYGQLTNSLSTQQSQANPPTGGPFGGGGGTGGGGIGGGGGGGALGALGAALGAAGLAAALADDDDDDKPTSP